MGFVRDVMSALVAVGITSAIWMWREAKKPAPPTLPEGGRDYLKAREQAHGK